MLIYLITNKINGKQYVGQTIQSLEKRWQRHCWKSTSKNSMPICKAIAKYGKENFTIEKLCDCSSIAELNERELFYTNELKTWSPNGYNLKAGNGNGSMSQETKDKIAAANIGQKRSDKQRQNMSNAHKGKILPIEQRKKISDANKGENNAFYGKKHTQKELDKMSKTYIVISPSGEVINIKNMAEHCRKYGLNNKNMNAMVNGHRPSCQGWTISTKKDK
jgi:group I intron endonuclease